MKSYLLYAFLFGLLLITGCGPAIDSPKTYDNNTIKFSYPGNWDVIDSGSRITVQEKLVFGLIDGDTSVLFSIDDLVSPTPEFEHSRDVQTKILNKTVKGQLSFDWLDGFFQTTYFVERDAHSVRIWVSGRETTLKNSEPGVRQILESLEFL